MTRILEALAVSASATVGAVAVTVGLVYADRALVRRHSARRTRPA